MASSMVIKVKYGDTLRRFNASVDENNQLDLDMDGLRAKAFSLFNLPRDADIIMTYLDEDGDIVTLVDDDDLRDAVRQQLKFLRIDVHIKNENSGKSNAKSSGSATPSPSDPSSLPNFNNGAAADVLKSLPEPFRELISKLPRDLASKAASSSPVFAEIVDRFSKLGLSYMIPDSQVQGGEDSGTQSSSSKSPVAPSAAANVNNLKDDGKAGSTIKPALVESSSQKSEAMDSRNVTKDVRMSVAPHGAFVDLNFLPYDSYPSGNPAMNPVKITSDDKKETAELHNSLPNNQKKLPKKSVGFASTSSAAHAIHNNDMSSNQFNECPFTGSPIADNSAIPVACRRVPFKRNHTEAMGGIFHTGVQCDGCGCHPIVGPRFKSTVKEDYDLCRICYSSMGNASDYIRIDHPVSFRHPRIRHGGLYQQPPWVGPLLLPKTLGGGSMKTGRPKLDSRFVLDVNVMDGTLIAPSTPFTKIWRMRNNGGLVWPRGTKLVWTGGDIFSKSDSTEIEIPAQGVPADSELDIAVDFTAPESPGRYISYWRMATSSGQKFGQRVWVLIQVDASLKDSFLRSLQNLNLNLPPEICDSKEDENIDVNQPAAGSDFLQPSGSTSIKEPEKLISNEEPENDQELHFPINDSLLVGQSVSPLTMPRDSSTVSYPTVDVFESAPPSPKSAPVFNAPTPSAGTSSNNLVEDTLLKELEEMGFKQVKLNKEILRRNEYNLEQSVDDLCDVSEWDPMLEELQEMGFCDTEMNKKLLVKNNGSIKRVVMDLINGEQL